MGSNIDILIFFFSNINDNTGKIGRSTKIGVIIKSNAFNFYLYLYFYFFISKPLINNIKIKHSLLTYHADKIDCVLFFLHNNS